MFSAIFGAIAGFFSAAWNAINTFLAIPAVGLGIDVLLLAA